MKNVLILDLDLTLVHSFHCEKLHCEHKIIPDHQNTFCTHFRPNLSRFLNWCNSKKYKIVIYSAASKRYVQQIVNAIFEKRKKKPVLILDITHLTRGSFYYTKKIDVVKEHLADGADFFVAIDDDPKNYEDDERVVRVTPWKSGQDVELLAIQTKITKLFLKQKKDKKNKH